MTWSMGRLPGADSETEEGASCLLRCVVKDADAEVVGKPFTAAAVELALASYPGFTLTAPPGPPSPYGIYRPAYVDRDAVEHTVHLPDGSTEVVPDPPVAEQPEAAYQARPAPTDSIPGVPDDAITRRRAARHLRARAVRRQGRRRQRGPLGARRRPARRAGASGCASSSPSTCVRRLVPEAADLEIEIFALPNLHGVNVLIHGLLGDGVAASTRFDPQAKALGEWLRSRLVSIPEELL